MGKTDYDSASSIFINVANALNVIIVHNLVNVSNTIITQAPTVFCPLNLYSIALKYGDYSNVRYEPELFHSLSLHIWENCHVNIFASGKIVLLGRNSKSCINDVLQWLNENVFYKQ